MKKILLACAAVAALVGGTACSGSGSSSAGNSFGDSLSVAFGKMQGAQTLQMTENIPADVKSKFSKDSFLRGFKQAVMADTADVAYIEGLMAGSQAWRNFNFWREQQVADADAQTFYDNFAAYFKRDSISMEEISTLNTEVQALFNQATARLQARQDSIRAAKQAEQSGSAQENKAKAAAYLDSIKAADKDVKVTPSGLGYKVVKQGKGALIGANDNADVIYTGRLIDGTQFDSSNGQPVNFNVAQVVPGFSEGLQLMNPGSKYIFYIPSDLGYGDAGNLAVPGGAMMVFDVEIPAK